MLAEVVGGKPGNIALTVGPFGKPQLSHPEQEGIRFNLSHAGDKLLLALTAGCEVGVDLEKLNAQLPFSAMAERFFSERENLELSTLPLEEQLSAFYRCWTRKEAYLKGTGTGFSQPANGFDISLLPQQPPALLTHRGSPGETTRWSIRDLAMPTGYCAALAFSDDLSPLA
jgi:4'-phosphopantetheinyl transferase